MADAPDNAPDRAQHDSRSEGRRNLNSQIAKRQKLLLAGIGVVALLGGSWFTLLCTLPSASTAQTTEAAKADDKQTARDLLETARDAASAPVDGNRLPNYDPAAVQGLEDLADDPARIESRSRQAAQGHQGQRTIEESLARRARFSPSDIEAVIARAGAIGEAPLDFTAGIAIGGAQGSCVPLPPGSGSAGSYIATCNTGTRIDRSAGLRHWSGSSH